MLILRENKEKIMIFILKKQDSLVKTKKNKKKYFLGVMGGIK